MKAKEFSKLFYPGGGSKHYWIKRRAQRKLHPKMFLKVFIYCWWWRYTLTLLHISGQTWHPLLVLLHPSLSSFWIDRFEWRTWPLTSVLDYCADRKWKRWVSLLLDIVIINYNGNCKTMFFFSSSLIFFLIIFYFFIWIFLY